MYVSFDDGDHWQSMQLNLPFASDMRDLGRARILILLSPRTAVLFGCLTISLHCGKPARKSRPRMPICCGPRQLFALAGIMTRKLPFRPNFPRHKIRPTAQCFTTTGNRIRRRHRLESATLRETRQRFSSEPPPPDNVVKNVPDYWFGPLPQFRRMPVSTVSCGICTTILRRSAIQLLGQFARLSGIHAFGPCHRGTNAARTALGPLAVPGVRGPLTVGDQKFTQPLAITLDPRVHASQADLDRQFGATNRVCGTEVQLRRL